MIKLKVSAEEVMQALCSNMRLRAIPTIRTAKFDSVGQIFTLEIEGACAKEVEFIHTLVSTGKPPGPA